MGPYKVGKNQYSSVQLNSSETWTYYQTLNLYSVFLFLFYILYLSIYIYTYKKVFHMQLIVINPLVSQTHSTVARDTIMLMQSKMIASTVPSSPALFGAFLFATTFFWTFPEFVLATSQHESVTRHYNFDVRTHCIPFKQLYITTHCHLI